MRTRARAAVAIAASGALLLAGCSGGGGDDGDVRLTMVETLSNPARVEVLNELIAGFEDENPGVTVELVSPPTEQALTTVQQMLQAGAGVDVLEVQDSTIGSFAANDWLYDMNGDLADWDGWDELTENAKSFANEDGPTYMVPYGFYGLSLFYRTDLIEEAGFDEPPHSWEDLIEMAAAINDPAANTYGYAFRGGTGAIGNAAAIITAYAGDLVTTEDAFRLEDGSTVWATDEADEAMNDYLELFQTGSPPSAIAWGYPEMVQGFASGSTAFLLQDPEVIQTIRDDSNLEDDQWGTTPLLVGPSGKALQPIATAGWGVAASSEHPEEATALVEYLATGDAPIEFAKRNSLVPIVTSAADDPYFSDGPWATYVAMNEDPDTYRNVNQPRGVAWSTEWQEKADREMQEFLLGEIEVDALLEEWDRYWTEKYASVE
jgi:multiple sugar transport system substrate-binding protein